MKHNDDFTSLPTGASRTPVALDHFPDALHAVVWRNWDLVPVERLAEVLNATPRQIEEIALSMGLEKQFALPPDALERCYVTLIRRNWHLLPYEQLCRLLNWDAGLMSQMLLDEDFLWVKLGMQKPECESVAYRPPSHDAREHAALIREIVNEEAGRLNSETSQPPLAFIKDYLDKKTARPAKPRQAPDRFHLRMVYPYFLRYGDPLSGSAIDDVPESLLEELADQGVNAIWLQGVLARLAPWKLAPDQSDGWEERLENLNRLADRAARFDIGVYLYLNEPRSMSESFFDRYPHLRGVPEKAGRGEATLKRFTLCTSTAEVQEFLVDSVQHVFRSVPRLAGAFTITHSENLTNCYSRQYEPAHACPRCRARSPETVIAEVNELIARGMHSVRESARLIVWDWAWPEPWVEGIIQKLPANCSLMRVSEWDSPFRRGDFDGKVGEYSISVVGPSEQSQHHWRLARRRGLQTIAKVQVSNSWELSSVPYIPAMALIARHISNLCEADVDGLMLGWTLGGLPCLNFQIVSEFLHSTAKLSPDAAMLAVAEKMFGNEAAETVIGAWKHFSDGFSEFPFDIKVVYFAPLQMGPANLLYAQPTGYAASMVGIPYDDLAGWRGPYRAETILRQFEKVAEGFKRGVAELSRIREKFPSPALDEHLRVSQAGAIHFQSVANQIQFVQHRGGEPALLQTILKSEIDLARQMCDLVAGDSRIGFEATNHYYYTRCELVEKILNCRFCLRRLAGFSHRKDGQ